MCVCVYGIDDGDSQTTHTHTRTSYTGFTVKCENHTKYGRSILMKAIARSLDIGNLNRNRLELSCLFISEAEFELKAVSIQNSIIHILWMVNENAFDYTMTAQKKEKIRTIQLP